MIMKSCWRIRCIAYCFAAATSFLSAGCDQPQQPPHVSQKTAAPLHSQAVAAPIENPGDLRTAIIRVAQKAIPAVVHIDVTERQTIPSPMLPFENDPFFRYFFNIPKGPREQQRELKGLGTGMIIDNRGHILTNHHVAGGATKITVVLDNGKEYPAKLVGSDPKTDLAVIKITDSQLLPFVEFGDSDKVEVGEWVVAIGHPRGLDQTVTQGIISAKHRQGITDPTTYQDFLQTDAAINPGNSGGPLLNLQGQVIGVNAVIASTSGGSEGIGFAIPSNMAIHVSRELIAKGKVERGWLGINIQDLTPELAEKFGVTSSKGALIADVVKNGPAERAGIKRGDVIVAFNGRPVNDPATLRNNVANTAIGSQADVTVVRNGKEQQLSVTIGNMDEATKVLADSLKRRLGGEFKPVSPTEAKRYRLSSGQGIIITKINPRSPLAEAGLEVKDLILAVNQKPVSSVEDFLELVNSSPAGQPLAFFVVDHRTGNSGYVQIELR